MQLFDVLGSIFMFFLMVAWIWVLIGVVGDVFRSHDIGGMAKAIWMIFIILVPWLGVLAYIIIRGEGMQQRNAQLVADAAEAQRTYIQNVAGVSTADELAKLAELKEKGVINEAEFEAQKTKLLAE